MDFFKNGKGAFGQSNRQRPEPREPRAPIQGGMNPAIHGDRHLPGHRDHSHEWSSSHQHYHGPQHAQSQVDLQRTIQASIQMMYDVYDYNIGMIEELEKHETHGKQIQNSGILSHVIPADHRKPIQEVFAGIELQLKCLQAQMVSLPSADETIEARKKLIMQTIKWAASREAAGIPHGHVDHYCKNVLEILLFDAPQELPRVDHAPKIELTNEQVNEAMFQMAKQRHLGDKQDEGFQKDPRKEAKLRKKRQAEDLRGGALRLAKDDRKLADALEKQGYVPDVSMDTT